VTIARRLLEAATGAVPGLDVHVTGKRDLTLAFSWREREPEYPTLAVARS
jgi:hypothetical protein